jgi:hypothetical protein
MLQKDSALGKFGICRFSDKYTAGEVASVNATMGGSLKFSFDERPTYIRKNELYNVRLLDRLLSHDVQNISFATLRARV